MCANAPKLDIWYGLLMARTSPSRKLSTGFCSCGLVMCNYRLSLCKADGQDAYDDTVDGEVDEIALLHQSYHPFAGKAARDECCDESYDE